MMHQKQSLTRMYELSRNHQLPTNYHMIKSTEYTR
jgi:hypothetical protein